MDVTESMAADRPAQSYEEQVQALSQALPASVFITDERGLVLYVNPYWSHFTGLSAEQTIGAGWTEAVHPDDLPIALEAWARAGRDGQAFSTEVRCRSAGGGWLWVLARIEPVRSPGGTIVAWIGVSSDIDERRRSEEESRRRQARFEALVRASATIVFELDEAGVLVGENAAWRELVGPPFDQAQERDWIVAVHPDERTAVVAAWRRAFRRRQPLDVEFRQWRRSSRTYRWMQAHIVPVAASDGRAGEWIGALTDIHDKKVAAETQHTLVLELQHRVRNSLAVVRSLSVQTARHATDVPDFLHRFDGRLTALAHAHGLLTSSAGNSVDLLDLAHVVLQPFRSQHGGALRISGPSLAIGSTSATNLSLAFHELATNAIKYGAMSSAEGRVALNWAIQAGRVDLSWRESGGPPTHPPAREGFGSRLLSQTLSHESEGEVSLDYDPEGFRCTMRWRPAAQVEAHWDAEAVD